VICRWSHVPRQADVQDQIGKAKAAYVKFLLCTPASVLAPPDESPRATRHGPFR
jgi:hypothetical protein